LTSDRRLRHSAGVSWREAVGGRLTTPAEALRRVRPGDTVAVAPYTSTPLTLCRALHARRHELSGVRIEHGAGHFAWDAEGAAGGEPFTLVTNYATPDHRAAVNAGRAEYLPVSHWHADGMAPGFSVEPDVYLLPVSPPDAEGRLSFGTGAWFSPVLCRGARTVIGEVHEDFIRVGGDSWASVERFAHLVPAEEAIGGVPPASRSEEETAATEVICTLVAHELVRDRDTLQIGVGTVSSALGLYLEHRHDLGIQTEAITAGIPDLVRRGVVTGRYKTVHPGLVVGSFMIDLSPADLAYIDRHPAFALYGFGTTDDVTLLVRETNLTAVNNALLIDLTGQVASEGIGPAIWSGAGGQTAFAIAAAYAPGGRAIFVLPSTHRVQGTLGSRIVAALEPSTVVTVPRGFVDYVVTEHGIARLRGKTLRERAGELIAVAHPDFRAELRAEAGRLHHV
jgi:4-hydroxybutyrate CoA-transferase